MRVAAAFVLVLAAGCGSAPPLYAPTPGVAEVVVDGAASEWPSALRPVPDEAGLSLGLRIDGDELVVALIAGDDRQARRIALGGVRLWIDPMGGDDRTLGLRYPTPEAPSARDLAQGGPRRGGRVDDGDPTRLRRRFETGLDEVEVTRGVLTQRITPDGGADVEAAAMWGPEALVVEMRVPLDARPGLLEMTAGGVVGIGVELLDVRRPTMAPATAQARGPRGGGDRQREDVEAREPTFEPATVTRWLRVERGR